MSARKGIEFMTDATVENNVSPNSSEVVRAFVREAVAAQDGEGYAVMCEVMAGLEGVEVDYGQITCPAVVVAGLDDRISSFEVGKEVAKLIEEGSSEVKVGFVTVNSGHQHVL